MNKKIFTIFSLIIIFVLVFTTLSCTGEFVLKCNTSADTPSDSSDKEIIIPALTFRSPASFSISVNNNEKNWNGTIEYSTDAENWTEWDGTSQINSASNGSKHVIYMRGYDNTVITGGFDSYDKSFKITSGENNVECKGDIRTLLDWENPDNTSMRPRCFAHLFNECAALATAPELPATELTPLCYLSMFKNCTSLTTAPDLPATTLTDACYSQMFAGCTSLTEAPDLPATELADDCYLLMFDHCSSLKTAPALPATDLAMGCYREMFSYCTSLNAVPDLPATYLPDSCYRAMFANCSNLKFYNDEGEGHTNFIQIGTDGNSNACNQMLVNTGGDYEADQNTVTLGQKLYTPNQIIK